MLFLSVESWTIGIIRTILVIWGWIWGVILIYQGKKSHVKLLIYWGIYTIGQSSAGLGTAVELITILITGHNMDGRLYILLTWVLPSAVPVFFIIVTTELLAPKFKWWFFSIWFIGGIFAELFLFLDPLGSDLLTLPDIPGEDLIIDTLQGPVANAGLSTIMTFIFLGGFGLIYKGIQSQGIIRKKYFYIATAILLQNVLGLFNALLDISIPAQVITGIFAPFAPLLSYFGLRKEPEKRKKKVKEEVKIKDSFFRITERPDQITEEEVTYYREQKICLMCKGKVGGFNTYICTNCEALYHHDCARTLSELENACWVCNQPIDETKPTKPFKIVEETKVGEILTKEKNNSRVDNKNSHKER
ncbi:MAG: PHD finger domain-containing protein [Promethearchaeota archaeon]